MSSGILSRRRTTTARQLAGSAAGSENIEAEVKQGTRRDAMLFSFGANAGHGLRRTNGDKRRAVSTMLGDAEWSGWSDREIARRCAVDHVMVGRLRASLVESTSEGMPVTSTNGSDEPRKSPSNLDSEPRQFINKHGTVSTGHAYFSPLAVMPTFPRSLIFVTCAPRRRVACRHSTMPTGHPSCSPQPL